jgi:hypothetical protein
MERLSLDIWTVILQFSDPEGPTTRRRYRQARHNGWLGQKMLALNHRMRQWVLRLAAVGEWQFCKWARWQLCQRCKSPRHHSRAPEWILALMPRLFLPLNIYQRHNIIRMAWKSNDIALVQSFSALNISDFSWNFLIDDILNAPSLAMLRTVLGMLPESKMPMLKVCALLAMRWHHPHLSVVLERLSATEHARVCLALDPRTATDEIAIADRADRVPLVLAASRGDLQFAVQFLATCVLRMALQCTDALLQLVRDPVAVFTNVLPQFPSLLRYASLFVVCFLLFHPDMRCLWTPELLRLTYWQVRQSREPEVLSVIKTAAEQAGVTNIDAVVS